MGSSWEHLGTFWDLLGPSGEHLGASWGIVGPVGAILGASWGLLEAFWAPTWSNLGPSYGHLTAILGHLTAILSHLPASLLHETLHERKPLKTPGFLRFLRLSRRRPSSAEPASTLAPGTGFPPNPPSQLRFAPRSQAHQRNYQRPSLRDVCRFPSPE